MQFAFTRKATTFLVLIALALFSTVALAQQETGQVSGTVTDKTGAVVTGARVTMTNLANGATRTAQSGTSGQYTFAGLQPGQYEVKVDAQGFSPVTRRIHVTVGSRNTVDMALAIGGAQTTVEVVGTTGVEVQTQSQELSQVVTGQGITDFPTLTRNPYDLVATSGNVSGADPSERGVGFAINGQRAASTNILLDGGENVDQFDATTGQAVPLDAVDEFRVITSNFSAEYGRATGGIVNVSTKQGTNAFHGSAYLFNRISALAANTYANSVTSRQAVEEGLCADPDEIGCPGRKGRFTRNQFGYSLGGPILKNKLFFFSSTEWTRIRSAENLNIWTIAPEFVALTAPGTQEYFQAFGQNLQGSVSQRRTLGEVQAAGEIGDLTGLTGAIPAGTPFIQQVSFTLPTDAGGGLPRNAYSTVNRIDFTASDRLQVFGRYGLESEDYFPGTNSFSPYAEYNTGINVFNQNLLLSATRVWTPSFVTVSKFIFNRLHEQQPLNDEVPLGPTLYTQGLTGQTFFGNPFAFPGYLPFSPGNAIPFGGPQNVYQFNQDFNWTRGKHQFRFGAQYIHNRDNRTFGAFQVGVAELSAQGDPTEAFNNLLAGQLYAFSAAVDPQGKFPCRVDVNTGLPIETADCIVNLPVGQPRFTRNNRYNDVAWYVQDTWKVTPRLTLNLGLRWEYYGVQHNAEPELDANFYYGSGANFFEQIANGSVQLAPNSPVGGLWEKDLNNFAPRVGFGFDVFGDGTTSVRGGYGISYERNFNNVTYNVIQNPPHYAVISLLAGLDVPSIPLTSSNFGPLGGNVGSVALPRTSLRHVDQNIIAPYTHFWNLAVERQIVRNTVLELGYTGSRGLKQYSIENLNRPGAGLVYLGLGSEDNPFPRLNNQYTNINSRRNSGDSYYNALNVAFRSSNLLNSGLNLTTNYTWAHAIDDISTTFSESYNNFNLGLTDPFNPGLDKGDADFDIRHRVVVSANWEIPAFRNTDNAFLRNVFGGWEVAPIFTAQTGTPFTIWDCSNILQICARYNPSATPARTGEAVATGPNQFEWLSNLPANAEWTPTNPTGAKDFGPFPSTMSRRNAFRGPGRWNMDMGIYKNFRVTERVGLQFRGELYNVFNHHNYFIDGSSAIASDTPFSIPAVKGRPDIFDPSEDERRNVQLGLKVTF